MGRKAYKFDGLMRSRIIELYSQGYSGNNIAKMLGISAMTLSRWRKKYPEFNKTLQESRDNEMQGLIIQNLVKQASGGEYKTIEKSYFDFKTDENGEYILDDDGKRIPIKVVEKIVQEKGDHKANEILARKFSKDLSAKTIEQNSTTNILNIEGMSYRELLEYNKDNNVLDAGNSEVIEGEAVEVVSDTPLKEN